LLDRHRLPKKVVKAHLSANAPEELQAILNAIDSLATDCTWKRNLRPPYG
jgi:hypothetical protein